MPNSAKYYHNNIQGISSYAKQYHENIQGTLAQPGLTMCHAATAIKNHEFLLFENADRCGINVWSYPTISLRCKEEIKVTFQNPVRLCKTA